MARQPDSTSPNARPPLERMLKIHHYISHGDFPNASRLAESLEVSSKSIQRDIEFMRDRMDLPIKYDSKKFGYYYTQEVNSFPAMQITEGELLALLVAEKALQQYRGTNFEKPLMSAFKKMANSLPDTISLNLSDWDQTISFRTSAESILNLEIFDVLARATATSHQLELEYRKPGKRASEKRVVDPYHLANINGEWFLFGFDHLRKAIRTFVPARILSVINTGKTFRRPEKFSLEKELRNSFGVMSGKGQHEVTIRFDPFAADYIREKKWHPTQKIKEHKDGQLTLSLELSGLHEVQRWILGWGGHAIPLSPPSLVESVKSAAEKIQKNS